MPGVHALADGVSVLGLVVVRLFGVLAVVRVGRGAQISAAARVQLRHASVARGGARVQRAGVRGAVCASAVVRLAEMQHVVRRGHADAEPRGGDRDEGVLASE